MNTNVNSNLNIKRLTLIIGVAFILIGLAGFIPGINVGPHAHDPNIAVDAAYGRLMGIFPVNMLHNLVHLGLGVWAVIAAKDIGSAVRFNRINAVLYAVLAVAGLFPVLNTFFGFIPLFSHDVWLHAVIALATGYLGFVAVKRENLGLIGRQHTGTYIHP